MSDHEDNHGADYTVDDLIMGLAKLGIGLMDVMIMLGALKGHLF